MKKSKSFLFVPFLIATISFVVSTCFFLLHNLLFLKKPSVGGGFGGINLDPNTSSSTGYIIIISAVEGVVGMTFLSPFVLVLLGIFLGILVLAKYKAVPVWSIPVFSVVIGAVPICFFYFAEDDFRLQKPEELFFLIGSSFCGVLTGLLVMLLVRLYFDPLLVDGDQKVKSKKDATPE